MFYISFHTSDNSAVHQTASLSSKQRTNSPNAQLQYVVPVHVLYNRCMHARTLPVPSRRLFRATAPSTACDIEGTLSSALQCTGPQPPVSTLASNIAPLVWKQEPWMDPRLHSVRSYSRSKCTAISELISFALFLSIRTVQRGCSGKRISHRDNVKLYTILKKAEKGLNAK